MSCPGETAQGFSSYVASVSPRIPFLKNHTYAICNYGINDVNIGVTLENLKSYLLSIWSYLATRGLIVYQATITPKTTSTDFYTTLVNQAVTANESVRLGINAWLRDTSSSGALAQSNGTLTKILDTAATIETDGKWNAYSTPFYSGQVASAGSNYI